MPDVTVVLAHFHAGKQPGDKLTVPAEEARALYRAGIARTETKGDEQTEAKAAKEAAKASGA